MQIQEQRQGLRGYLDNILPKIVDGMQLHPVGQRFWRRFWHGRESVEGMQIDVQVLRLRGRVRNARAVALALRPMRCFSNTNRLVISLPVTARRGRAG